MAHYRGWVNGRVEGQVEEVGSWRQVKPSIRIVWTNYKVPAIGPNILRWRKRHLPITEVNFRPMYPCSALHGSHCLSREFTGSAKLALEKQTSQPSLVMVLCMCSMQV